MGWVMTYPGTADRLRMCVEMVGDASAEASVALERNDWHGVAAARHQAERWAIEAVTVLAEWAGEP